MPASLPPHRPAPAIGIGPSTASVPFRYLADVLFGWRASRDKTPISWDRWRSHGCGDWRRRAPTTTVHVSVKLMPGDPALAECRPGITCSE
jgi:hypothetical protein